MTKVRALLAGQPARLDHATAAFPLRLGQPPAPEVPIWVAALGRRTLQVAAELGDGSVPVMVARDRLAGWVTSMREAADPRALTVAAGPLTGVDEDASAARSIAASCAAWYLTAMGDVYARSVSGQGYGAEVSAIIAANPRPSPRQAAVPADAQVILDQLAAYGTRDQMPGAARALGQGGQHRHDRPATRPTLGQHRSDPAGRGTRTDRRTRSEPFQAVTSVRSRFSFSNTGASDALCLELQLDRQRPRRCAPGGRRPWRGRARPGQRDRGKGGRAAEPFGITARRRGQSPRSGRATRLAGHHNPARVPPGPARGPGNHSRPGAGLDAILPPSATAAGAAAAAAAALRGAFLALPPAARG